MLALQKSLLITPGTLAKPVPGQPALLLRVRGMDSRPAARFRCHSRISGGCAQENHKRRSRNSQLHPGTPIRRFFREVLAEKAGLTAPRPQGSLRQAGKNEPANPVTRSTVF